MNQVVIEKHMNGERLNEFMSCIFESRSWYWRQRDDDRGPRTVVQKTLATACHSAPRLLDMASSGHNPGVHERHHCQRIFSQRLAPRSAG